MPTITDVGVGGILALLILKEVFSFVKYRKNGNGHDNSIHDDILKMHFVLAEIRSAQDKTRESNHRIVEKLQEVALLLGNRRAS